MLYALQLEAIGDNIVYDRRMHRRHGVPWQPKRYIELTAQSPWVALITGRSERFGLERRFIAGRRDYSDANSTGSRGIWIHYLLDDGLYEINQLLNHTQRRRYFLRVQNGEACEVSAREVGQCLT